MQKNLFSSPLKRLLLFEICARETYEKFVYKHSETIQCVKGNAQFVQNTTFGL